MALKDLSTFLSRYFIIGYYVPTLCGLASLAAVLRADWVPNQFELTDDRHHLVGDALGSHLLAVAVFALPAAFLLTGIRSHIFRIYRTFPLFGLDVKRFQLWRLTLPFPKWLQTAVLWPERRRWDKLFSMSGDTDQFVRAAAASKLFANYPAARRSVQPARFGNIVRAYEEHTSELWGMDHLTVWPRVEALFTDQEQALHDEVRTTLSFAITVSLFALVVGVANGVGMLGDEPRWRWGLLWYLLPFGIWYIAYRMLVVDALVVSGQRIRSSMDLHRLDLYRMLGVQPAETFSTDEQDTGRELSEYLAFGPQKVTKALGRSDWQ